MRSVERVRRGESFDATFDFAFDFAAQSPALPDGSVVQQGRELALDFGTNSVERAIRFEALHQTAVAVGHKPAA